jgi:hypothetical protein
VPGTPLAATQPGLVTTLPTGFRAAPTCKRIEIRVRPAQVRAKGRPFAQRLIRARAAALCAGLRPAPQAAMFGQITYQTPGGGTQTTYFERGTVQSVSGDTVVIKAANGQTQTWQLTSSTVIRSLAVRGGVIVGQGGPGVIWPGKQASQDRSALVAGRQVLVAGPGSNGSRDIRLAVVWPAGVQVPAPSPSPSAPSATPGS